MASDAKKVIKTIVAVPATLGVLAAMIAVPVILAAIRGPISADHYLAHKAGEHALEELWQWTKR